jgi:hypothetical protein
MARSFSAAAGRRLFLEFGRTSARLPHLGAPNDGSFVSAADRSIHRSEPRDCTHRVAVANEVTHLSREIAFGSLGNNRRWAGRDFFSRCHTQHHVFIVAPQLAPRC